MKKLLFKIAAVAALGIAVLGGYQALKAQTISVPQVTSIGASDLFQDVVGGVPVVGNVYASAALLGNYSASLAGNNVTNDLIGGDFTVNLFQDGATVSTITTAATYVADQWAAFSGTSTTIGGAQETGAADIPSAFGASLRITRTGAGVIQSCVAQIVASGNVLRYQGSTAEVDFHALAGSGFSAASSNLSVYLVTGTGTNDTMANLAKTINSALAGTAWAGNVTATATFPITTAWTRYTSAFPVPASATELGVAICWTPVGASPSNDYFEFTGAQLVPNSALTSVAGSAGAFAGANDGRAKSFARRPQTVEQLLQYAFYWRQNEAASASAGAAAIFGTCQGTSTSTLANCNMTFPVPMYKVPTFAYTAGTIVATVGTAAAAEAVSALAIPTNGATLFGSQLTATSSSVSSGAFGYLESGNSTGGGKLAFSARF
jgi:hypothetical protein